ncbi:MAG: hypothetical protein AAGD25_19055 [Cyanobacteria bacterium P01_F01_bin.150]
MAYLTYLTAIGSTALLLPLAIGVSIYWLFQRRFGKVLNSLGLVALGTGLLALATYVGLEIDYGDHRGLLKLFFDVLFYVCTLSCITTATINIWQIFKPFLAPIFKTFSRRIRALF